MSDPLPPTAGTVPPAPPPPYGGPSPSEPPPLTAFAWRHGLVRPAQGQGRLFAGVCGAFGRATNTDPVLWRVILVVLSVFGGIGVFVYLLGWLLLPADGDTASPAEAVLGRGRSATSAALTVIAGVILLLSLGVFFSEPFRPGPWGIVLVAVAVVLLLRDRRRHRTGEPTGPATPPPAYVAPTALSDPASPPGAPMSSPYGSGTTTTTPPPAPPFAPYGPFGGPPPTPPVPPVPPTPPPAPRPPRERSRLGRLTFSVGLIVLGTLAVADLSGRWSIPTAAYLAAALTVIGLGLVLGAWWGRARGLIALGIVLSLVLGAVGAVNLPGRGVRGGNLTWVPASVEQIDASYSNDLGNATLDLSQVDFSHATQPVEVTVSVHLGNLEVILPSTVDATVNAKVNAGNADIFNTSWGGLDPGERAVTDLGTGGAGGGSIVVNANVDLGNLEVHR